MSRLPSHVRTGHTPFQPGNLKKRPIVRARPRQTPGQMNKTEARYAAEVLDPLKRVGKIVQWQFEPLNFRLAKKTFYRPDFVVIRTNGTLRVVEVKGYWEDDARVKIKVAAEMYWWAEWVAVTVVPKKDGGGWKTELFFDRQDTDFVW